MFLDDGELEKLGGERARGRFASALASLRGMWGK
jgi:hypothetical protein